MGSGAKLHWGLLRPLRWFQIQIQIQIPGQDKAMQHCDLRVRWKVASDLRFRAATCEPKTPSFCGISGDLAQSTQKSLAIGIVRCGALRNSPTSRKSHQNFTPNFTPNFTTPFGREKRRKNSLRTSAWWLFSEHHHQFRLF